MSRYPDHNTYALLYRRYVVGRDIGELLDLLEPLNGTRVLDLCAGDGRLSLGALERGARMAVIVEGERAMVQEALFRHTNLYVRVGAVEESLCAASSRGELFDRVVCRQAVNYWLNTETAALVASALISGGIFAFNTFNRKPAEKPRVLEYEFGGHAFTEVSWLVGNTVHHLQVRDGMAPHHTAFVWISPEAFRTMLEPYFTVTEECREKTSLYRCEKK